MSLSFESLTRKVDNEAVRTANDSAGAKSIKSTVLLWKPTKW